MKKARCKIPVKATTIEETHRLKARGVDVVIEADPEAHQVSLCAQNAALAPAGDAAARLNKM